MTREEFKIKNGIIGKTKEINDLVDIIMQVAQSDISILIFGESGVGKEIFAKAGISESSKVHIYCFKGARTSNMYMAMKMAGIKNVKNYLGSWNEWSRDFSLPIEQGYPRPKGIKII